MTRPFLWLLIRALLLTRLAMTAARRWVAAVNSWGQLGRWAFHVCRDPQTLGSELEWLTNKPLR